jgi:hypothetical protein
MCDLTDNEIYPEDSPLAINNYALGYQDFTGCMPGRSAKQEPLAPDNNSYMRGWYCAQISEVELTMKEGVSAFYSRSRSIVLKANKIKRAWEEHAKARGWETHFPI